MADNVCINCKWAAWTMTNHQPPRVNPKKFGRCGYPMERVALPVVVTTPLTISAVIWPTDTKQCRVWERK